MSETRRISFSKAGNLYVANVDNGDVSSYKSTVANTFAAASVDRASVLVSVTGEWFVNRCLSCLLDK